jgi:hypothetical protein
MLSSFNTKQDYVGAAHIVLFAFNIIASFLKQKGGFFLATNKN